MVDLLRCAGCQSALRLRPEYAGKKLRCPKCQATVSVPAAITDDPPPLPNDDDDDITDEPQPAETADEAVPRRRRSRRDADDTNEWVPCPRCGEQQSERVLWTFWGSFYGPGLFNHVKCPRCGKTYNGANGRSNFLPALIFTLVPLLLILGLVGVTTWIILSRQF